MTIDLGLAITATYTFSGGEAVLHEHGLRVRATGGAWLDVEHHFPPIGRPHVPDPAELTALPAERSLRYTGASTMSPLVAAALVGRVALVRTGTPAEVVPLVAESALSLVPGLVFALPLAPASGAPVPERVLYDVAFRLDDGSWRVIAPHAFYRRAAWTNFGMAHITDLHVASRNDRMRATLRAVGQPIAADGFANHNDKLRGLVRYANYLHDLGVLDVVLATGDLVDFAEPHNARDVDEPNAPVIHASNVTLFVEILMGRPRMDEVDPVEELRVPIFVTTGNHDYRPNAYDLLWQLKIGTVAVKTMRSFSPFNLGEAETVALQGGIPVNSIGAGNAMAAVDAGIPEHHRYLSDQTCYTVRLGKHRLVVLDSGPDAGIIESAGELAVDVLFGDPDGLAFSAASPNSEGVSAAEVELVKTALDTAPTGGLVMVAIHAPPFAPWGDETPFFLRETQRDGNDEEVAAFLVRDGGARLQLPTDSPIPVVRGENPAWFAAGGQPQRAICRGAIGLKLQHGASRGEIDAFVQTVAGLRSPRPADLVLTGHGHRRVDYRIVRSPANTLEYRTDFYTDVPEEYYPSRFVAGWSVQGVGPLVSKPTRLMTRVQVVAGAPAVARPRASDDGVQYQYMLDVPPYPTPLSTATDPAAWWNAHRPLVLQTGALGPIENSQVSFSGFRVVVVTADVIQRIHYVRMSELEKFGYRMPWTFASGGELHLQSRRDPGSEIYLEGGAPACGPTPPSPLSARWAIERVAGGGHAVRLRSVSRPDQYLHIEGGALAAGPAVPTWHSAQWFLDEVPGTGCVRVRNRYHPARHATLATGAPRTGLVGADPGARWRLEAVTGTAYVRLRSAWKPDQCLHVENGPLQAGVVGPGFESAQWSMEPVAGGSTRFRNRWKPDRYLHAEGDEVLAADPMAVTALSARWFVEPIAGSTDVRLRNGWDFDRVLVTSGGGLRAGDARLDDLGGHWRAAGDATAPRVPIYAETTSSRR